MLQTFIITNNSKSEGHQTIAPKLDSHKISAQFNGHKQLLLSLMDAKKFFQILQTKAIIVCVMDTGNSLIGAEK